MKNIQKKNKSLAKEKYSLLWKILLCILIVALIVLAAGYIVIHSYLRKIDYQNDDMIGDNLITETEEELWEEEEETGEDSPENEIAALEEHLREQISSEDEALYDKNVLNILLIGCDSRTKNGRGRSDSMILVSINQDTKEIYMTSIMRDSYVSIPGHQDNRINAAYAYGGASLLMDTIETNFKIKVDKYAAVDFYSFVDIVDSIGGIDLEVSDAEAKVMNTYIRQLNRLNGIDEETSILEKGGAYHLNGTQTLAYSRVRYVGNADFERTQRQRTVLTKVFEKAQSMNLLEMNDLLNVLLPEIKTNMSEGEVLSLLLKAPSYLKYDLLQQRIPADGSYSSMRIRGMAVLGIDLEKNRKLLEETIYKK